MLHITPSEKAKMVATLTEIRENPFTYLLNTYPGSLHHIEIHPEQLEIRQLEFSGAVLGSFVSRSGRGRRKDNISVLPEEMDTARIATSPIGRIAQMAGISTVKMSVVTDKLYTESPYGYSAIFAEAAKGKRSETNPYRASGGAYYMVLKFEESAVGAAQVEIVKTFLEESAQLEMANFQKLLSVRVALNGATKVR